MVYKFLNKKTRSGININKQLAEEYYKNVIKKFKTRKIYTRFKDNFWTADLIEMRSLIAVFTKYAWVTLWKINKIKQFLQFLMIF